MGDTGWTARRSRASGRLRALSFQLGRVVFGDRVGLALFLGSLCFAGFYWRIGFFINDNVTLANGLVALADGHLWIDEASFGSLRTPGMHIVDGRLYARNYGQLVAALPLLWALRGLSAVGDVGLLPSAFWSLSLLGFSVQAGHILDRRRTMAVVGSTTAGGWFLLNLSVARPIATDRLPLIALAGSALLAASMTAVLLYRLLARLHGRRVGVAAAAAATAATPLGFWATIPKRHVFTALAAVGVMYALSRSRSPETAEGLLSATGFRALAYAQAGFMTWIHAPEGAVLFLALAVVDVPTAPRNDARTLALVGGAFLASLLPVFLTNTLISGNPLRVPRVLPAYDPSNLPDPVTEAATAVDSLGGSGDAVSAETDRGGVPLETLLSTLLADALDILDSVASQFAAGALELVRRPVRLYRVFVRGGYIESISAEDNYEAIYLTFLESAPFLSGVGALAGSAVVAGVGAVGALGSTSTRFSIRSVVDNTRRRVRVAVVGADSGRVVDAFVATAALALTLIYLPRLPIHAQVTVRYLLPLYPLCLYAMARHAGLRRVLSDHARLALWSWAGGVAVGVQLLFAVVSVLQFGRGEAFQIHATVAVSLAALLVPLAISTSITDQFDRATAVGFGFGAALGTNFLLLSGVVYFTYGQYALPAVGRLSRLLSIV